MNFTQIEKILIKNGWKLLRTLGSNCQYGKYGYDKTVIIHNYGQEDLPLDMVKHLEKITGLSLLR